MLPVSSEDQESAMAMTRELEYERQTRQQRYEGASLNISLKSSRFNPPKISAAAAERLKKALNNAPPLAMKESGEAVKALQNALLDLQHPSIKIPDGATGYFGQQTHEALVAFQRIAKLVRHDGLAGNETLGHLDKLYLSGKPPDDFGPTDDDEITYCPFHMMIPRLKQPSTSVCWATAAAMVYYWRYPAEMMRAPKEIHEFIKYVLRGRPHEPKKWLQKYGDNEGLFGPDNSIFYNDEMGMKHAGSSPHEDYGLAFWTGKLKKGPMVLISARLVGTETLEAHALVVIGIRRFSADNMPSVFVIDPWDGQDKEWTMRELMRRVGWLSDFSDGWRKRIPDATLQYRDRIFYW